MRGVVRLNPRSLKEKEQTKKQKLLSEYYQVFKKIIDKEKLSLEEEKRYVEGFKEVTGYIRGKMIGFLESGVEVRPEDRKLRFLYRKWSRWYETRGSFDFNFREELGNIIEEEIYNALGFGKKPYVEKDGGDFISYVYSLVYYRLLKFIEKEVGALQHGAGEVLDKMGDPEEEERAVDALMEERGLSRAYSEDVLCEVKRVLLGGKTDDRKIKMIVNWLRNGK